MNDNKFDFLIIGTGYSESILSSALSSSGYKCLHIDKNDYYGDNWATLPITELDSSTIKINNLKNPNKFLISRHPSVILTERGKPNQLDTILKSSVFNYLSFKLVDSLIHYNDGEFTQIPKSKQEVFKSTISLKDKRMLMKLLQWIASREFLKEENMKLSEFKPEIPISLFYSLIYSFGMAINLNEDTHSAFNRMSTFMNGHGVYGQSCFLYSQYGGVGDIIQGYCRSSAVHGSTFILNHALESLEKHDSEYSVRLHDFEETFTVKKVISNAKNLYPNQPSKVINKIGRAVLVLNMPPNVDPLPESPILGYPPMAFGIRNAVHVHWQSSTSGVCPPGYYIVYFAATLSENEETTLDELYEGYINSLTTSREDIEFLTIYVEEESEIDVKTDVELIKQEPTTIAPFVQPSEKAVEEASRVFELLTNGEATEMFASTREKEEE